MAAIVEVQTNRYQSLFSDLQSQLLTTCEQEQYLDDIFGISMLDSLCDPMWSSGVLERVFSHHHNIQDDNHDNMNIIFTLNSPNDKNKSNNKDINSVCVGGRKFVVFMHQTKVRLYAVTEDKEWTLVIRKLDIGLIVVAFSKHFISQQVIPIFERFCDNIVQT
jgi:hypothetical protein